MFQLASPEHFENGMIKRLCYPEGPGAITAVVIDYLNYFIHKKNEIEGRTFSFLVTTFFYLFREKSLPSDVDQHQGMISNSIQAIACSNV